jgi:hypothetical protein
MGNRHSISPRQAAPYRWHRLVDQTLSAPLMAAANALSASRIINNVSRSVMALQDANFGLSNKSFQLVM